MVPGRWIDHPDKDLIQAIACSSQQKENELLEETDKNGKQHSFCAVYFYSKSRSSSALQASLWLLACAANCLHQILAASGSMSVYMERGLRVEDFPKERKRIQAAFDLFDKDHKSSVPKEEVGTIMRYLGAFPTEEELEKDILPEVIDDNETQIVKYERFEPFMLRVLVNADYEPDAEETILQAFRTLDPDGKGYLDEATMRDILTEGDHPFRDKELDEFLRSAKDPDTGYIHFEEYVNLLMAQR